MKLRALTLEDMNLIRSWRNQESMRPGLRIPFLLTEEMQADFYRTVVCRHDAPHRFWAVVNESHSDEPLVAMVGLTYIQWENGLAEISLITDPEQTRKGYGSSAVFLVLREAFERMRLATVIGECYTCNIPALWFWQKVIKAWNGHGVLVPRRKWWNGQLWESYVFTIWKQEEE